MKKIYSIIIITAFLSCSKSSGDGNGENVTYSYYKVLEIKTNNPINGAEVLFEKCTLYDVFECTAYATLGKSITDAQGTYRAANWTELSRITASHDKYWSKQLILKPPSNIFLTPLGWTALHVKNDSNYPLGYKIDLYNYFKDDQTQIIIRTVANVPAQDTIIYLRSGGDCKNGIQWSIVDNTGMYLNTNFIDSFVVNKFDTSLVALHF